MKTLGSHRLRIGGCCLPLAGMIGLVLGLSIAQSLGQDSHPPEFEPLHPRSGSFGVERTSILTGTLRDDTAVDPATLRLRLGEAEPIGPDDPRLRWSNETFTFTPAAGEVWGSHGETVTVWVSAADVWGNLLAPVAWTFTLELETIVNDRVVLVGGGGGRTLHGQGGNLSLVALGQDEVVLAYSGSGHGLRPGDILVGLNGEIPYYRKILALSEVSGTSQVKAATGDVSLLEVFNQASIRFRNLIEVSYDLPAGAWHMPSPNDDPEAEDEAADEVCKEDSKSELSVTLSEQDGLVTGWLDGAFEISRGNGGLPSLTRAQVRIGGTMGVTAAVTFRASGQGRICGPGPTLVPARMMGKPLRVLVGSVPVIIHAEFDLRTKYDVSAEVLSEVEVTSRFEQRLSAEVALKDGAWVAQAPELSSSWDVPIATLAFDGKMTGRVALVPRLRLVAYGLTGVWASAEPYLLGAASVWLDPQTLNLQHDSILLGGIDGQVGYGFKDLLKNQWDDQPLRTFEGPQNLLWGSKSLRVSPDLTVSRLDYGFAAEEYPVKYQEEDFLPGHGPDQLEIPPRVIGPGPCAKVGHHVLRPSGGSDPLYSFVPQETSLEVRPREVLIEVDSVTRTVGNPNPPFTAKFRGLAPACNSEADFDLRFETDADEKSPPGPYEIRVKIGRPNPNYDIKTKSGTLNVEAQHENLVWVTDSGADSPRAAVDAHGTVHVVSARAGGGILYRQATAEGLMLTGVMEVFPGGSRPDVVVDPAGIVHVCALNQSATSILYARLDQAGSVIRRKVFGPDSSIGVDVFETWATSVAVYVTEVKIGSVRMALLPANEGFDPVIGLIYSTEQRASFDWSPPPLSGFSMGEIFNYIAMLGVQATLATPRMAPGGEWVAWYRLDDRGEDAGHGMVHRKWGTKPLPETMGDLSLAVDGLGRPHFAWREISEGHATIAWATGFISPGATLQRVTGMALDQGTVGPPELSADGDTVALAWAEGRRGADESSAEIRKVRVAELQPSLRFTQVPSDAALTGPVGLARAGRAWRVAWVDDQGSQLKEAVLGWDVSGRERLSGPRVRTSAATLADIGVVSRVATPFLASRGDVWALAVAAGRTASGGHLDVALYVPAAYGGIYGLSPDAKLWDQRDLRPEGTHDPIALHCDLDLLSRQEGNYHPVEGVVADGVTPLLFRLGGLPAGPLRLGIAPDWLSAQPAATELETHLSVAGGFDAQGRGTWQRGLTHTFDPVTQGEELYVTLAGVALEQIAAWPPLGAEQRLSFALQLYRDRPGEPLPEDRILSIPFIVRKPPLVLVHGYNTDGDKGWGAEFKRILRDSAGIIDAVFPINYGTDYGADTSAEGPGYYLNTILDLEKLRTILSEELIRLEDTLHARWAMTRYDVVGHSQGGLLLRMLCADEYQSPEGFINNRNFGRGRFRRIITVGSPHNGSRLAHYLSTLRSEIVHRRQSGTPGLGADQVYFILDWKAPNILQDKFDPFLDDANGYIRQINRQLPTHTNAHFHLISSVIDHRKWLPNLVFRTLGLSDDERLETVVPKGKMFGSLLQRSDGVVDYQSHFGGVINPMLKSEMTEAAAHAEAWLYGAAHAQGDSTAIAHRIVELLYHPNSGGHFGRFDHPQELRADVKLQIDELARTAASEAVLNLAMLRIQLLLLNADPHWQLFLATVTLLGPEGPRLAGLTGNVSLAETEWMVRVYAPDVEAVHSVTWERSGTHPGGIELRVPEGLQAQIVALALASPSSGGVATSAPTLLYDTLTQHIRALVIGGVPPILGRQERFQASVLARLEDGAVSEFHRDQPEDVRWESSDTNVVSISPVGSIQTGDRTGTAEITVTYGAWSGRQTVTVTDQMPMVAVIWPADGAVLDSAQSDRVQVMASDADGSVEKVVLYLDDQVVHEWTQPPYVWEWASRRPGDHILRAVAVDDGGGMRGSLPVEVTVLAQPPECFWVTPEPDLWRSGALRLEARVSDPDAEDTATVAFEFSLHSTDGRDGEWLPCAAPLNQPPFGMWWQTEPLNGVDDAVWLRVRATDGTGLSSAWEPRRIRVDNTTRGVLFEPHPGEDQIALNRQIIVRFDARPARADGASMSDGDLAALVILRDAAGAPVECTSEVSEGGLLVRLRPARLLAPRRQHTIEIITPITMNGIRVPAASSVFRTTFGTPAGLRVSARPIAPEAGLDWEPPLEVMVVDTLGNRVEDATGVIRLSLEGADGVSLGSFEAEADLGVARFRGLNIERAGQIRLGMSSAILSLTGTDSLMVLPGPLASFGLEVPKQVNAGERISLVSSAYDAFGNLKLDYAGAPRLSSGDARATLRPLPAFRPHEGGRRAYADVGSLGTLGDQWLQMHSGEASGPRVILRVMNVPPHPPEAVSPRQQQAVGLTPQLEATAFSDADDAGHGATHWQISQDPRFDQLDWDEGMGGAGTSVVVPAGRLLPDTLYYWRARYRDAPPAGETSLWSPWSEPAAFRTARAFPFMDDFSVDRGWRASPEGGWIRRSADGVAPGTPVDDTSEGADRMILATVLDQTSPGQIAQVHRIISPAVDCTGQRVVELAFRRWLTLDASDWAEAELAVSVDGENWTPVWRNGLDGVADTAWQEVRYDITSIAAGQPTVYVGFSLGPWHHALPLAGWHVDDIRLHHGVEDQVIARLDVPATHWLQGEVFEARILVQEQIAEVHGFLGGAFDLTYDPSALQLASPASADQVIHPPFNHVKTEGAFTVGRITGLGGVTLEEGHGDGAEALFATLQFRALLPGVSTLTLSANPTGCVLPLPVGSVGTARIRCSEPLSIHVQPPPVIPSLDLHLEGPTHSLVSGDVFEVRVVVRENHPQARGFLGGGVDLFYDDSLVEPVTPLDLAAIVDPAFQSLGILSGALAESRIDELGGVTLKEGLADGTFVTYLRVPFHARRVGRPVFGLGPAQAGLVLASPVGEIASADVSWPPTLELQILDWPEAQVASTVPPWSNQPSLDLWVTGTGIVEYRFSLNGGAWSAARPIQEVIQLRSLADGSHQLRLIGRNARGTWQPESAATLVAWQVDTRAPAAPALLEAVPPIGSWTGHSDTLLSWKASTDGHSGLAGYRVAWSGSAAPPLLTGELVTDLPARYTATVSGEHWGHIAALDNAGNTSVVVTLGPIRFDQDPPQLILPDQVRAMREMRIPIHASDVHSGLHTVVWRTSEADAGNVLLMDAGPGGVTARAITNGTFQIEATATDVAGNATFRTLELVMERRPPHIVEVLIASGSGVVTQSRIPLVLTLDPGDADHLEYQLAVNGRADAWRSLSVSPIPQTVLADLGNDEGRKELCLVVRDGDYPYSAYGSPSHCAEVRLEPSARLGPPRLSNGFLELTWIGASGWVLQTTEDLGHPFWRTLPESRGQQSIRVPITGVQTFFRLANEN